MFDYEIIFLNGGKIVYYFNAGKGLGKVESATKVNTGEWFTVSAQRNKKSGTLTVNGVRKSGTSGGGASFVNGIVRVHIGGAKKDLNTLVKVPVSICLHSFHFNYYYHLYTIIFRQIIYTLYKSQVNWGLGCGGAQALPTQIIQFSKSVT